MFHFFNFNFISLKNAKLCLAPFFVTFSMSILLVLKMLKLCLARFWSIFGLVLVVFIPVDFLSLLFIFNFLKLTLYLAKMGHEILLFSLLGGWGGLWRNHLVFQFLL